LKFCQIDSLMEMSDAWWKHKTISIACVPNHLAIVIQRQRIFVCRPTTNIRQNIIAEYSADNDKTNKSKNDVAASKLNNYPFFDIFLSRKKVLFHQEQESLWKECARAENRNQKLLSTTFVVVGRFTFVVVGRQRCCWITTWQIVHILL
jgi:hypothetical protein